MSGYDYGLDLLSGWASATIKALLVTTSYAFNPATQYVSSVVAAEVTVAGYSRQTLTTCARTVDTTAHRIKYTADDPGFGTLTAGETIGGLIVYKFVTTDANSLLIGYLPLTPTATAGAAVDVAFSSDGVFYYT